MTSVSAVKGTTPFTVFTANGDQKHPVLDGAKKVHSATKKVWDFLKHPIKACKNALKGVKNFLPKSTNPTFLTRLSQAIASIGLLSLLNTLLTLGSCPNDVKRTAQAVRLKDGEGVIKETIGLVLQSGGILSDITTFVGSLVALEAIPKIAFFSVIAFPLGIVLLSAGILNSGYNLLRQGMEMHQMNNVTDLTAYLNEKLDVSDEEVKVFQKKKYGIERPDQLKSDRNDLILKKEAILTRHTDKKVVTYMKKLRETPSKVNLNALADMKTLMKRKIGLEITGIVSKIAMLTVLVASTIFPLLAPIALPVVGGVTGLLSMGTHIYKNKFMDRGLINVEFLTPKIATAGAA